MPDLTISFTIPGDKVDEYVAHFVYVHKNPGELPDRQWVREHILNYVREQVKRGRTAKYQDEISAYNADDIA